MIFSLTPSLASDGVDFSPVSGRNNGNKRTTTMTEQPTVLCAERGQPIPEGQKVYMMTLGKHDKDNVISESVFDRLPISKRRRQRLEPDQRGVHVYEAIIESNGIPTRGEFLFSMTGSLAEISTPRLWKENQHLNN